MDESKARETLKHIVPASAGPTDWLGGVRAKRRQRRAVASVAAALGVTALVVPLALTLNQGGAPILATPSPTLSVTEPSPSPSVTGGGTNPPSSPTPEPSNLPTSTNPDGVAALVPTICAAELAVPPHAGDLPAGPTRAWLCPGLDETGDHTGPYGPPEPLVNGVDGVRLWNSLRTSYVNHTCDSANPAGYRLVVEYAGRSPIVITGGSCEGVPAADRNAPDALLDHLRGLWRAQRATISAVVPTAGELCLGATSFMKPEVTAAAQGVVCGVAESAPNPLSERIVRALPDELARTIGSSMRVVQADGAQSVKVTESPWWVVLQTQYGDPMTLTSVTVDGVDGLGLIRGEEVLWMVPDAAMRAELATLTQGMRAAPFEAEGQLCAGPERGVLDGGPEQVLAGAWCTTKDGAVSGETAIPLGLVRQLVTAVQRGDVLAEAPSVTGNYVSVAGAGGIRVHLHPTTDGRFALLGTDGAIVVATLDATLAAELEPFLKG